MKPAEGLAGVLLVRGCPRSGTTLLVDILNENAEIAIMLEYGLGRMARELLPILAYENEAVGLRTMNRGANRPESGVPDPFFLNPEHPIALGSLRRYPTLERYPHILSAAVRAALEKNDAGIIGSKTPGPASGFEMRFLHRLFPKVQFVYVVRNPYDTINSTLNRRNLAKSGFDQWHIGDVHSAIDEYRENMNLLRSVMAADRENCFVLGYDDLMREPTETIQMLGEFLGVQLQCSPKIADRNRARRTVMTGEEVEILLSELGPIIESWSDRIITGAGSELLESFDDCVRSITPGVPYRFGTAGGERSLLGSGWAASEPNGVWSDDYASELHFATPSGGRYALVVEGGAFVPRGQLPLQVTWSLDGIPLGQLTLDDDRPRRLESQPRFIAPGPHRLAMAFNVPRSPQQCGLGADYRLLGMFLRSLELQERD